MGSKPLKSARVYDKHAPEGQQDVAHLASGVTKDGRGYVVFVCTRDSDGLNILSKHHAVEFASMLLMLALGLPGDMPAGDIGFTVEDLRKALGEDG